jgi:purine catabolism regulator
LRLTIGDILRLDILKSAKVRSGKDLLNDRNVRWISAMEMPVENFVRKDEVVLSTAIGCGHDFELFKNFVQDIINSEATALVVALGRYIFDIPKEIIDLAEKKNFIIIEIPWEVRFSSIIEDVIKKLNDRHYKELKRSEMVQQELLKLILREEKLDHISQFIESKIGSTIFITDRTGMIQAKSKSQKIIQKWEGLVLDGIVPTRKVASILTHDPMFQKFQVIEIEDQRLLQLPILDVTGEEQSHLYVILPDDVSLETFLTEYRVNVLEHSVTTIALWFSRKNAIEDTKVRLRSDFVQELVKGEFVSWDQANSRAKLLGYNIKQPYLCMVGFPENLKALFHKRKHDYDSFEQWLDSMINYMEEEFSYAAQTMKKEIMMTYYGEQLIIFLNISPDNKNESANNFLDLVERRLRNLLPEVILSWGIGNYYEDISGFKKSYQDAKVALDIGRKKKGPGYRVLYENTIVDRVLLSLAANAEMKEVIEATISPIVEYDEQRNMDLINTFTAYNQYHGNVSQTARALNLHRQSLLYRLRKIETLTGRSLIDPDDLFLLDLSIKIWKIGISKQIVQ